MTYTRYTVIDNTQTNLDANISSGATSFDVVNGSVLNISDGDLIVTLVQYNDQTGTELSAIASGVAKREKVLITGIAGNTITVTRGFDGDTPQSFTAGSYVYVRLVARHLENIYDLATISGASAGDFLVYGASSFENQRFLNPNVVTLSIVSSEIATDCSLGNMFKVELDENVTMLAPTNPTDGQFIQYRVKQDATGSRLITWNSIFNFGGAGQPTLTTTAEKTDYISFRYNSDNSKFDYMGAGLNY
jgi:hypothetical protein